MEKDEKRKYQRFNSLNLSYICLDEDLQAVKKGMGLIEVNGALAGAGVNGLTLAAGSSGNTIRGLAIQSFSFNGILVQSASNVIAGSYVGLDADGTTAMGNNTGGGNVQQGGILVQSATNTIGGTTARDRNVVSATVGGLNRFGIGLMGDAATGT